MTDIAELVERATAAEEWIREPDWEDDFNLEAVADWLNRRPSGLFSRLANAIEAMQAELAKKEKLIDGIDEERSGNRNGCIERNIKIHALEDKLDETIRSLLGERRARDAVEAKLAKAKAERDDAHDRESSAIMGEIGATTRAERAEARLAECEGMLRGLLDCPDIADNDHKDEETHAAERTARAYFASAEGASNEQ